MITGFSMRMQNIEANYTDILNKGEVNYKMQKLIDSLTKLVSSIKDNQEGEEINKFKELSNCILNLLEYLRLAGSSIHKEQRKNNSENLPKYFENLKLFKSNLDKVNSSSDWKENLEICSQIKPTLNSAPFPAKFTTFDKAKIDLQTLNDNLTKQWREILTDELENKFNKVLSNTDPKYGECLKEGPLSLYGDHKAEFEERYNKAIKMAKEQIKQSDKKDKSQKDLVEQLILCIFKYFDGRKNVSVSEEDKITFTELFKRYFIAKETSETNMKSVLDHFKERRVSFLLTDKN